ncbi:MAG: hypothetical protein IT306_31140 [Chloroflexi bacterium]|nr:hypothetical protein [Chloroflexota bacterium]
MAQAAPAPRRRRQQRRWPTPLLRVALLAVLVLGLAVGRGAWEGVQTADATVCSPRPPVSVRIEASGGRLHATVSAGAGNLRQMTVRPSVNAAVTLNGRTVDGNGETTTLATGSATSTLTVVPVQWGQPVTVPIVVTDDCGPWTTFVGGGAEAFGPMPPPPTATVAVATPTATVPMATATTTATATPTGVPLTPTPTRTPAPTTPTVTPTQIPMPAPPVSNRPAWNGVPRVSLDYTQDAETWWAGHPFNPESSGYAPEIASPGYEINVLTQYGGNIQAAIDALPSSGGTLIFPAGAYTGGFRLVGRSHVHFLGEPGAIVQATTENMILGCPVAADYAAFGAQLQARAPSALACATTDRIRDVYIRGLTFDGMGTALQGLQLAAAQDVVFDGVTLQNYANPGDHHRGLVSGNASLENVWFRGVRFVGRERYALYLDGLHGGGVIGSVVENGFSGGALLFLTNDDFSRDYDSSGTVELPEQRMSQYIAVYGNTFAGGTYDVVSATGRAMLVKNNRVVGSLVTLANFQSKSSYMDSRLTYDYDGNRVIGNRVRQARQLVEVSAPPTCPKTVNCAAIGAYQIRDNVVESASTYQQPVKEVSTVFGTIHGPNVISNTCVGGVCAAGASTGARAERNP